MSTMRSALCIVAGPNGSGKTTATRSLPSHVWLEGAFTSIPTTLPKKNSAVGTRLRLSKKAAECATEMRYACFGNGMNFVFETVFSSGESLIL